MQAYGTTIPNLRILHLLPFRAAPYPGAAPSPDALGFRPQAILIAKPYNPKVSFPSELT
jgi:hypothetical protein